MKAAICISSELRNIRYSLPSIKEYFIKYFQNDNNNWDIDYFIYSPEMYIKNYDYINKIYDSDYFNYINLDDIKFIEDILSPKCLIIENKGEKLLELLKNFELNKDDYLTCVRSDIRGYWCNGRSFNQFHFAQQVIELKESYEIKNNFKYDAVFRIRPDLYFLDYNNINSTHLKDGRFLENSDYYKIDWPNSIFVSYIDIRGGCPQIGDHFFFGNSTSMDMYHRDMVKNLVKFYNELKEQKLKNTMWENLQKLLDPPERKWYLLGLLNKISFVNTLNLPATLIRDHFEKNTWTHENKNTDKISKHQHFIACADQIIHRFVINNGYDFNKIIHYFKQNDLFQFKTENELSDFMENNPCIFKPE